MSANPKLPLSVDDKKKLRKAKVNLGQLHTLSISQLMEILDIPMVSAQQVKALAQFQQLPSIGYELADKLVNQLHIYSLEEIRQKEGAQLFDELEQALGVWTDSCVEDQIRCVIHHANHPGSEKQWFAFTEERKLYREMNGYPKDRPTTAWYEAQNK
ncbi:helix-hairpin-helix domain-containing protein [Sutcliffiella sp. NC1]|uniref:helix-hairpin-helix domain-containing protein n=1 Tax=Sutcliffiella sp. NC1 TaxID=3004096 RepID=UPI0022DDD814|nr:helix-hairpin-helix domain-containing protein [Sutcliffiella sp. NC1]WBL13140.1 Pathogenicity locus [Sutcliffiella sp. NC1]